MKILIVEDEKALNDSIVTYLQQEGMICEVAREYESASQKIHDYDYDVVVVERWFLYIWSWRRSLSAFWIL